MVPFKKQLHFRLPSSQTSAVLNLFQAVGGDGAGGDGVGGDGMGGDGVGGDGMGGDGVEGGEDEGRATEGAVEDAAKKFSLEPLLSVRFRPCF